ncbi:MAG: radical SAM protein [Myxococcales bacterium]|jgi:radical SAM superfamily enzyme YgiQ (UPF0313 family)
MRYEGTLYRPPSEADALIVQATIGCSWNHCTYCSMYRDKRWRVRPTDEVLADLTEAAALWGPEVEKLFIADGDALGMPLEHWLPILERARGSFPRLRRVSCYANTANLLAKSPEELRALREAGLSLLYLGPESGDDQTLKRIAKGATFDEHVRAAKRAHEVGLALSVIVMLGIAGREGSQRHAEATARLVTEMDPEYLAALTTTVVEGTPLARAAESGQFELPSIEEMLAELRTIVALASPRDALFRTNHASNYLPLAGRLPRDRERLLAVLDTALEGKVPLRPEWLRGL